MAVIDSDAGEIVIRVVYDGPPEAGKTTSVRALAGSLAQPTETPGEDAGGRTLWFDWMEYVGGRFEGCRIRCQIVSVPGQRELGERRRRLLEHADVVVFVGDSSTAAYPQTIEYLLELRTILAARVGGGVGVGVVLQANKRDLPDAVPLAAMRERLGEARWDVGVVESVAADGTGIREAFVYAVRLALDRVRELMSRRELAEGAGARTGAEDLLAALRA
ncbi:MAG: GTPase domain-containing protein, partial [Myxococcales bacterium]|nr:GTPase domain-containing protein [Myxococcales bacterium]